MRTFSRILVALILAANSSFAAQNKDIAPGDNLIVEGIPKISSSLVASASRYTNFRYAGLASWHPTKREMLISTEFGETPQIHLLKFPGGARTQLTFFSDYVSGPDKQAAEYGYGIRVSNGNLFVAILRLKPNTPKKEALAQIRKYRQDWQLFGKLNFSIETEEGEAS